MAVQVFFRLLAMESFHAQKTGLRIYKIRNCYKQQMRWCIKKCIKKANEIMYQKYQKVTCKLQSAMLGGSWWWALLVSGRCHHTGSLTQEASSIQAKKTFQLNTYTSGHVYHPEPPFLSLLNEEHTNIFQEARKSPTATLASLCLGHPFPNDSTCVVHGCRWFELHGLHHIAVADTNL